MSVITLCTFFFQPTLHPLHVSTTEVLYNPKEKSLEVTIRIFTDDLEAVLAANYKEKVDLANPRLQKAMDKVVSKYVKTHLSYKINGRNVEAAYIGYEIDKEAVNVYFELRDIGVLQSVNISNSILYDRFDDQMNILHIEKPGMRKSVKVNYPDRDMLVRF